MQKAQPRWALSPQGPESLGEHMSPLCGAQSRPFEPCRSRGPGAMVLDLGKGQHKKPWYQQWWDMSEWKEVQQEQDTQLRCAQLSTKKLMSQ